MNFLMGLHDFLSKNYVKTHKFADLSFDKCSVMSPQDVTLQHYMDYTAESLIPVMAHIAKNVMKVNDGLTKHMVSVVKLAPAISLNLQTPGVCD